MSLDVQLHLSVPADWTNDQKGAFFEEFVAELLAPMRYRVLRRLRFTGMEIDLLAEGQDQRRTILVECKAQRDPLAADVITKLLGNVQVRNVDAGWLFSVSDLSKDGRGLWHDIQDGRDDLASRFTWYPPEKICEILIAQRAVQDPNRIDLGDRVSSAATLSVTPSRRAWFFEILRDGIPSSFVAFDAVTGQGLSRADAVTEATQLPWLASLDAEDALRERPEAPGTPVAPVARVSPGDSWEDPRPARPVDFVGRDDVIDSVFEFFERVQTGETQTRNFAVQGPSGWGKSSLVLKIADLARQGRLPKCSVTAVDTRSAVNASFVSEALRTAFADAVSGGLLPVDGVVQISSLAHPLSSESVREALRALSKDSSLVVLIFDQFEELFSKEPLFEIFALIRELSLQIDAIQAPLVLGFAWKTDIVLPQQHPAYYLWHELSDRRTVFPIREFGTADIRRVLSNAEAAFETNLTPALRSRLVEQCQGFPWLLKKLLVHILRRLPKVESQYELLERELDIELLFKEDLAALTDAQVRCLKYVAANSPASVPDVESNFSRDATNSLTHAHLLVRSGMNYVVYWDIFRDYLTDKRVPRIPWARTFQREPGAAMRLLNRMTELGRPASSSELGRGIGLQEGPSQNLIMDLVALQVVDRLPDDLYQLAEHIRDTAPLSIAAFAQRQLERHVAYRAVAKRFEKGQPFTSEEWEEAFRRSHPNYLAFSARTSKQYATSLRSWLVFAGLLEQAGAVLRRPQHEGAQKGILGSTRNSAQGFHGGSTPDQLLRLLAVVGRSSRGASCKSLNAAGFRNAVVDANALGLTTRTRGAVLLASVARPSAMEQAVRKAVLVQPAIVALRKVLRAGMTDREVGVALAGALGVEWKPASAQRVASGLRRFLEWAEGSGPASRRRLRRTRSGA